MRSFLFLEVRRYIEDFIITLLSNYTIALRVPGYAGTGAFRPLRFAPGAFAQRARRAIVIYRVGVPPKHFRSASSLG